MKKLERVTVKRKVCELIPQVDNYKKITESKKKKLIASLEKFGVVDIPVIDFDGTLISGHQRLICLIAMDKENDVIDVRYPNRKLSKEELKEYTMIANTQYGDIDFDMLDNYLKDVTIDLQSIGVDLSNVTDFMETVHKESIGDTTFSRPEKKTPESKELKPFKAVHVLISFPPEKIIELQEHLEKIMAFDFVEYDQISN